MSDQHDEAPEFDPRSSSERAVDDVLGAKGLTGLDRQFAKILRSASDLFLNAKQCRKYLVLGEECDLYVRKAVDLGVKRAEAVARITDRLNEAGLGMADIRVNDWIAVYNLARLCTGRDTVKDMDAAWVGTHAYRTLAILKVAVERDAADYVFKPHYAEKVQEWLRDGVRGRRLEEAVKQYAVEVDEHVRNTRLRAMTPERQHQIEMAELAREKDKRVAAVNKAVEGIRERATEAGLSPDDLLDTLVSRGVANAPDSIHVPMDQYDMARTMDAESATAFAHALIERGNVPVVMALTSILAGWLKVVHAESAAAA